MKTLNLLLATALTGLTQVSVAAVNKLDIEAMEKAPVVAYEASAEDKIQFLIDSGRLNKYLNRMTAKKAAKTKLSAKEDAVLTALYNKLNGKLLLTLNDNADAAALAEKYNLTLLKQNGEFVSVQAKDVDTQLALLEVLKSDSAVSTVRLNIKQTKPQTR